MESTFELNLYDIPAIALTAPTRQIICNGLNKKKVLPSEKGLPRDWRGIVHLTGLPIPTGESPTHQLIIALEAVPTFTLGHLEEFLGELDRWDIVDDVYTLMRDDAAAFLAKVSNKSSITKVNSDADNEVLTNNDVARLEQRLGLQFYDALILYADSEQDRNFANEIKETLTSFGCEVCLKDDLLAGISFEHHGIMKLISERCRRVIVIVSPDFINSNANRFFVLFAQAISIADNRRIIIPVIYGRGQIQVPIEIKTISKLDYNRIFQTPNGFDFWGKLKDSITDPSVKITGKEAAGIRLPVKIREISNPTAEHHIVVRQPIDKLKSTVDLTEIKQGTNNDSITEFKKSSSPLSVKTHSSDENISSEKTYKSKSPKTIFKKIFKSKKKKSIAL